MGRQIIAWNIIYIKKCIVAFYEASDTCIEPGVQLRFR